jgi:ribosome-associated protein
MTEVSEKKDVQKLQRTIIDSLEDVKAQDIQVFNTEHLSPLFERVVIACGTSNRQTKALAANLRDDVRDAGFGKPRIEGEENGEWIIVDCGAVVVHIMQPTIRQYYHLEEIWGDKPVRIKLGAAKPQAVVKAVAPPKEAPKKAARQPAKKAADKKVAAKKGGSHTVSSKKPAAKKVVAKSAAAKKPAAKKSPPRKSKP